MSIDTHVHTLHSGDSSCEVREVIETAKRKGLDGLAITDHNSVAGLEEALGITEGEDFLVIPGIEVSSKSGHVLGLGVEEEISANLSAVETVRRIREKGGIAISAHPFSLDLKPFSPLHAKFDAIEIFNPKRYVGSKLAEKYVKELNLSSTAGSDAHYCDEVGMAGIKTDSELKVEEVLEKIKNGKVSVFGHYLPLTNHLRRIVETVFGS